MVLDQKDWQKYRFTNTKLKLPFVDCFKNGKNKIHIQNFIPDNEESKTYLGTSIGSIQ